MRRTSSLFALTLLALAACGQSSGGGEPEPEPKTITRGGQSMIQGPSVYIIVADDADTPEAAELRASVVESVRAGLLSERRERFGSCGSRDPAAWHPGEVQIFIARPSAPNGASLLHWLDEPNLDWLTQTSAVEEIDLVTAAVKADLESRLAAPGEIYRPLQAAKRTLDLLYGKRLPESSAEASLVHSLPAGATVSAFIAGTRDDEDGTPITGLLAAPDKDVYPPRISLMGPAASAPLCGASTLTTPRLDAWQKLMSWQVLLPINVFGWPCADTSAWARPFDAGVADCGGACEAAPIVVKDGVAACKVYLDQIDLLACDPARGWRDPDGVPTLVEHHGETLRRCEVVQLQGPALTSCRTSLECSGCGSGFCVTEVPELIDWTCGGTEYIWPLRFPGGALADDDRWLEVTCEVE